MRQQTPEANRCVLRLFLHETRGGNRASKPRSPVAEFFTSRIKNIFSTVWHMQCRVEIADHGAPNSGLMLFCHLLVGS